MKCNLLKSKGVGIMINSKNDLTIIKTSMSETINKNNLDHNAVASLNQEYKNIFDKQSSFTDCFKTRKNGAVAVDRIKTGFKELDFTLGGGIPAASITGISGAPSVGKSTFAMQMAEQMAGRGCWILYFSYEMSDIQVGSKSIARNYFIDNGKDQDTSIMSLSLINKDFWYDDKSPYYMTDEQWEKTEKIAEQLKDINSRFCFIDCTLNPYNIDDIENTVENYIKVYKILPVVFIDYLHMIQPPLDEHGRPTMTTDKQILDYNMRGIRKISSRFRCPVVFISALKKDDFKSMADMASLSGSSGIPYNCDVIISLQYGAVGDKNEKFNLEFEQGRSPRRIKATITKNRFFRVGSEIKFDYYSKFDYFDDSANINGWKDKTVYSEVPVDNGTKPQKIDTIPVGTIGQNGVEVKGQKGAGKKDKSKKVTVDMLRKMQDSLKKFKEEDIEV